MRWCDRHDVSYVLGLARNPVLERLAKPFMKAAEATFTRTGKKQWRVHEVRRAAETWDRRGRVIVKVERLRQGPNVRFVVTNLLEPTARQIYDGAYTARGDMENRIKEQQRGLFADRTSCRKLLANQFRVLLASAAYVLIEHIRRTALAGTELAKAQVTTLRLKLGKIAGRVITSVRRVVLHLSSGCPYQHLFRHTVERLVPG